MIHNRYHNRYFGDPAWGPMHDGREYCMPTPVGAACIHCDEDIAENDSGMMYMTGQVTHRECMLRQIYGSVAHQQQKCSCFGGTAEDDPALTRRQAAMEAVKLFESSLPLGTDSRILKPRE